MDEDRRKRNRGDDTKEFHIVVKLNYTQTLSEKHSIVLCDIETKESRRRQSMIKFKAVKICYRRTTKRNNQRATSFAFLHFKQARHCFKMTRFLQLFYEEKKRLGTFHPWAICLAKLKLILERTSLSDSTEEVRHCFGRFPYRVSSSN